MMVAMRYVIWMGPVKLGRNSVWLSEVFIECRLWEQMISKFF